MLILFDHGTPRSIARWLRNHTVVEAITKGWDWLANGALLNAAEEAGFDVLLSTDKNIKYQQNLRGRRIAIVVLGNPQRPARCTAILIASSLRSTPRSRIQQNFQGRNIGRDLTEERIYKLFEWKNVLKLSNRKKQTVKQNFSDRRDELNGLRPNIEAKEFLEHFEDGGPIWRIFWLHCWQHERFPIYDQHVHRAMKFIEKGSVKEIPDGDKAKIASYIDSYIPFYAKFKGIDTRPRAVDKALWTFGKFLRAWESTSNEPEKRPAPFAIS